MDDLLIGIDLGGTNLRVGAVTPQGEVLDIISEPFDAARGPQVGIDKICGIITALRDRTMGRGLRGIGIGATGPVVRERGVIQNPYTLPTWEDVDIVSPVCNRFSVPVNLENDADAAALGEYWMGAGRGLRRLAAVTVGTGIGTALILDGKVYRGAEGWHPEGGHMVIDPSGPACYCGSHGCWESLAAGPAIALQAQAVAAQEGGGMLRLTDGKLNLIDARILVKAARQGDPPARRLVEKISTYLGLGLVNICMLYFPDGIVLSGGVMRSYEVFAPGIQQVLAHHDAVVPMDKVKIVKTQIEGQSGVIGAARSVLNLIEEQAL
jgi:glucokinase